MLDWFARLVLWATGRTRDEHAIRADEFDRLSRERDKAREDYAHLMSGYQHMNMELQNELKQHQERIDALTEEVVQLASELEKERKAHKECQEKLERHERKLIKLEAQMLTVMQRGTDH